MVTNVSQNPITGQTVLPHAETDKLVGSEAAKQTLEQVTGFKPLSERSGGTGWLVAFHIANFATAGIVGQIGAACANSQVMGSQKDNLFRHWGRTYLNATVGRNYSDTSSNSETGEVTKNTFRGEKLLRAMTKGWSEGLGAITGILVHPFTQWQYSSHMKRMTKAYTDNFKAEFDGHPPSMEVAKGMTVERLLELGHRSNQTKMDAAKREAYQIRTRRADPTARNSPGLKYNEIENGSKNLKAAFAHFLAKERSPEVMYHMDWARHATRDIDGAPEDGATLRDSNAGYELRMYDVMQGYRGSIQNGSEHWINISHTDRTAWNTKYSRHLADFERQWNAVANDLERGRREMTNETPGTEKHAELKQQVDDLMARQEELKNLKLPPNVSHEFGNLIQSSYDAMHRFAGNAANRFGLQLSYEEEKNVGVEVMARRCMALEPNGTRLVFKDLADKHGEDLATAAFKKFAMDSFGQAFMFKWDRPLDPKLLAKMEDYIANPPVVNESDAPDVVGNNTMAELDGQLHREDFSEPFRTAIQDQMNGYIGNVQELSKSAEWNLFPPMVREIQTAEYTVNDMDVTCAPNTAEETAAEKAQKDLTDAKVRPEDQKVISMILHQGAFACRTNAAQENAGLAIMPFQFGDPDDVRAKPGDGTKFQIDKTDIPGVYTFQATTRNRLNNIQDLSNAAQGQMGVDITDAEESFYEVEIHGQIDCTKPSDQVTVTGGHSAYQAVPGQAVERPVINLDDD